MAWSDRRYAQEGPLFGAPQKSATFWIVVVTIAIQVLIWLIGGAARGAGTQRIYSWFELEWSQLLGFQVWRYITYLFLHGSPGHLLWNMLILYFMGQMLEPHFGRKRFTQIYLCLGAFAALGYPIEEAFHAPPHLPVVGASGAILGLVGLFGAKFPRAEVRLIFIPVTGAAMAAIIIGMNILTVIAYPEGTGTATGVHLAGAAAGIFYGLCWSRVELFLDTAKHQRERKKASREADRKMADNREMDRILEKISEHGMGELTEEERDFLRRQSERLKSRS